MSAKSRPNEINTIVAGTNQPTVNLGHQQNDDSESVHSEVWKMQYMSVAMIDIQLKQARNDMCIVSEVTVHRTLKSDTNGLIRNVKKAQHRVRQRLNCTLRGFVQKMGR